MGTTAGEKSQPSAEPESQWLSVAAPFHNGTSNPRIWTWNGKVVLGFLFVFSLKLSSLVNRQEKFQLWQMSDKIWGVGKQYFWYFRDSWRAIASSTPGTEVTVTISTALGSSGTPPSTGQLEFPVAVNFIYVELYIPSVFTHAHTHTLYYPIFFIIRRYILLSQNNFNCLNVFSGRFSCEKHTPCSQCSLLSSSMPLTLHPCILNLYLTVFTN